MKWRTFFLHRGLLKEGAACRTRSDLVAWNIQIVLLGDTRPDYCGDARRQHRRCVSQTIASSMKVKHIGSRNIPRYTCNIVTATIGDTICTDLGVGWVGKHLVKAVYIKVSETSVRMSERVLLVVVFEEWFSCHVGLWLECKEGCAKIRLFLGRGRENKRHLLR